MSASDLSFMRVLMAHPRSIAHSARQRPLIETEPPCHSGQALPRGRATRRRCHAQQ
jgi:hypothetical protein